MRAVIFDLGGTLVDTRAEQYDHVLDAAPLHDHVEELLPILYRLGLKLALVTDDTTLLASLDRANMRRYFYSVVTPEHVSQAKPHPEATLLALKHLGVSPHEAVLVGDTTADILAGKSAQIAKTIAVTHGRATAEDLRAAGATHVVPHLPAVLDVLE